MSARPADCRCARWRHLDDFLLAALVGVTLLVGTLGLYGLRQVPQPVTQWQSRDYANAAAAYLVAHLREPGVNVSR
jgi:hypothetical protein